MNHTSPIASRVLIWDVPTRLFHWLLAAGILTAFGIAQFGGEHGPLFAYHSMIGIVLGAMLIMRLAWGIVGTRHARLISLLHGPSAVIVYLRGVISGKPVRSAGHNPASSWAIIAMLSLVGVIVGTGLMMSGGSEAAEEIHSLAVYLLLAVIVVHVAGVIVHTVSHKENIAMGMVTGKKVAPPEAGIRSASYVGGAVFLGIVAWLSVSLYTNYDPGLGQTKLPLLGTVISLGEDEAGESDREGNGRHHEDDD